MRAGIGETVSDPIGPAEYAARVRRAGKALGRRGFGALLLTEPADLRYFTGLATEFFESPTRPWYLVLTARGEAIACVASIAGPVMRRTWLSDVRTFASPEPSDEGIGTLAQALREAAGPGGPVAVPMRAGTRFDAPLSTFLQLRDAFDWRDDDGLVREMRMVKSPAEIEAIRRTCAIAARAFAALPGRVERGQPLTTVFRTFRALLHEEGADRVPYLAGAAAPGGYGDVISSPSERWLQDGDVLMLDTGAVRDGYFCDFDRNFALARASREVDDAHRRLVEAVYAAADTARPGVEAAEVCMAMEKVVGSARGGRLGHGLGLQLTEPPSLMRNDATVLAPGMVLTFEPVVMLGDGRLLVHEENVVVRPDGVEWLTGPAGPDIAVIGS